MFQMNDYIVYGGSGVCKVTNIGKLDISGIDKNKLYYTLDPIYTKGSLVYTPINNTKVIMRKVITKDEAKELIDDIPNIEMILVSDDKKYEQAYKEAMKNYECREWIRIIKTLHLRKQKRIEEGKKITSTDEKYLKKAEDCLYGELAITLEIPKDQVENFIIERVEQLEIIS